MTYQWERVAAHLERDIISGDRMPGDGMPSENDVAREYDVSRNTARRALGHLSDRGLITGRPGARRTVATRDLLNIHATRTAFRVAGAQEATAGADSWRADIEHIGHTAGEHLTVREGMAHEVGGRFGPGDGPVIVRELLRCVDGRPHNLARWYFPATLAAATKLALPADIPEGSIPYLSGIGFRPASIRGELEWRPPARDEAALLAIPQGVSMLYEYRTGYGPSGGPVFVSVTLWPGDRARLILEL